ncbi:hypothetical protein BDN70DRAFT_881721 [Pholiota conissans]|uniref:Uncharacterized protein n=1 Tax=Pholiota conissans TaxID=109636 RepID=A0A9P5YW92_9AGAR|nr:hypothetical protein BDN70DRAFT_881721 [Pholiota conissans]
MSSTTTVAGASVSFMPTSDGGDSDGGGGGMAARGANYFFGFLITFVVLLLIFVGCGIGSRRRFLARRRDGLFDGLDPWGQPRGEEQKEPVFYEHPLREPIFEDKWMYTTPLSMTLLRQPKETPTSADSDPTRDLEANDPTTAARRTRSGHDANATHPSYPRSIAAFITPFHERKQSMQDAPDATEYGAPEALDIAVMIAMPSPDHPRSQRPPSSSSSMYKSRADSEKSNTPPLPDVQIGVAHIPWHTEIPDSVS